jgi:hypothetical protein
MTPEGKVKAEIKKAFARFTNVWYFMPVTGGYGKSGVPDFVVCVSGKFFAVEAKAEDGSTTALQDMTLRDIRYAGGATLVVLGTVGVSALESYLLFLGGKLK